MTTRAEHHDVTAYAARRAAETRAAQGLPRYVDATVLAAASALLALAPKPVGAGDAT